MYNKLSEKAKKEAKLAEELRKNLLKRKQQSKNIIEKAISNSKEKK